jgi:hypothetical protein
VSGDDQVDQSVVFRRAQRDARAGHSGRDDGGRDEDGQRTGHAREQAAGGDGQHPGEDRALLGQG